MRNMSVLRLSRNLAACSVIALCAGCVEFAHFAQISDREGTWPVNAVEISQKQPNGRWKLIGKSDGKGKINIFKHLISGGGQIRLQKPGYRTIYFSESEFLQSHNILMQAIDSVDYGESPDTLWNERN